MRALKRVAIAIALAAMTFQSGAMAQDWPSRPITIVVPFTAGGAGDILSRMIGQRLEKRLGRPIVVESKPGAGGMIGTAAVAKAEPDGYTLLMVPSGPMVVNPTMFKQLSYDPAKDFVPIAMAAATPFVLVVNPSLPVKSVADLVALQKKQGKPMTFAIVGPGIPHHLFAEVFKGITGIETHYVPYKGSAPAITDVVAGHVPAMFCDLGPAGPMIASGKVRALGVTTGTRVAAYSDVPPLKDAGAPGMDGASWQLLAAPAKTPRAIVERLNKEVKEILAEAEVKEFIGKNGMVPMPEHSIESLQKFLADENARWGKVVRDAGLAGSR